MTASILSISKTPLDFKLTLPDTERLSDLCRKIIFSGYGEFIATFNPYRFTPEQWNTYRPAAFPGLRGLIDFLLLGKRADIELLEKFLGKEWIVLIDVGLAEYCGNGWVRLCGLSLFFFSGFFVFIDTPSGDPNTYFGDDSIALFTHLTSHIQDRCLDLCSGSGIQALQCAVRALSVDAVEINPKARAILLCNAALNGLSDKVSVFGGSLYEQLEDQKYDLITANPPLVPFPDDLEYPFVGHGGLDGFQITRNIVMALPNRLTDIGRAQIIGLTFSDGQHILIEDELLQISSSFQLDIRICLVNHLILEANSPMFQGLVASSKMVSGTSKNDISNKLRQQLDAANVTHLSPYYLFITHGSGRVEYQNISRFHHNGLWHV